MTPMIIERLLERYPYLASIPEDAADGIDSTLPPAPPIDWTKAGNIFPTTGEEKSHDDPEHGHDEEGHASQEAEREDRGDRWEDWALCLGAELMAEVRGEVWKQLHYTCSAVSLARPQCVATAHRREQGIAHNKAMSKVSAEARITSPANDNPAVFCVEKAQQSDGIACLRSWKLPARHAVHRCQLGCLSYGKSRLTV